MRPSISTSSSIAGAARSSTCSLARGASWAQAEELAQDVFAEAWIHIERFRGDFEDERAFGAWLAGIARNLHRTEVRKASATEPIEDVPCESDARARGPSGPVFGRGERRGPRARVHLGRPSSP